MELISDWFDFVCIFLLIILITFYATHMLPTLTGYSRLLVILTMASSQCYFLKKMVEYIIPKASYKEKKK